MDFTELTPSASLFLFLWREGIFFTSTESLSLWDFVYIQGGAIQGALETIDFLFQLLFLWYPEEFPTLTPKTPPFEPLSRRPKARWLKPWVTVTFTPSVLLSAIALEISEVPESRRRMASKNSHSYLGGRQLQKEPKCGCRHELDFSRWDLLLYTKWQRQLQMHLGHCWSRRGHRRGPDVKGNQENTEWFLL